MKKPKFYAGAQAIHAKQFRLNREMCFDRRIVKILAIAGKWAMVSRPGAIPYVALADELEPMQKHK